jgi:hypothetical protein
MRAIRKKTNELISHLRPNLLQILWLGASYCRQHHEKGGGTIYIHKNLNFSNINLDKCCESLI